jgi:glycine cleavage system H protein
MSGRIVAVNDILNSKPTLINQSPYESGWIIAVQPSMLEEELKDLFSGEAAVAWMKEQVKKAEKEGYAVKE